MTPISEAHGIIVDSIVNAPTPNIPGPAEAVKLAATPGRTVMVFKDNDPALVDVYRVNTELNTVIKKVSTIQSVKDVFFRTEDKDEVVYESGYLNSSYGYKYIQYGKRFTKVIYVSAPQTVINYFTLYKTFAPICKAHKQVVIDNAPLPFCGVKLPNVDDYTTYSSYSSTPPPFFRVIRNEKTGNVLRNSCSVIEDIYSANSDKAADKLEHLLPSINNQTACPHLVVFPPRKHGDFLRLDSSNIIIPIRVKVPPLVWAATFSMDNGKLAGIGVLALLNDLPPHQKVLQEVQAYGYPYLNVYPSSAGSFQSLCFGTDEVIRTYRYTEMGKIAKRFLEDDISNSDLGPRSLSGNLIHIDSGERLRFSAHPDIKEFIQPFIRMHVDYARLTPEVIMDINDPRIQFEFDPFADKQHLAQMGKLTEIIYQQFQIKM